MKRNWLIRFCAVVCVLSVALVSACVWYNRFLDRVLGSITPAVPSEEQNSFTLDPWASLPNQIEWDEEGLPILCDTQDVINILLIGSDARAPGEPSRSDVIMLFSVNRMSKKIVLSSVLRDIYVSMDGHRDNKLNSAYAFGGAEYLCTVLRDNFNLDVRYFVIVDFTAFVDVLDLLGGVDLSVTEAEASAMNELMDHVSDHIPLCDGIVHLNGRQSLAYVRDRSSTMGDFDRTERQRKLLNALFQKLKDNTLTKLLSLTDALLPHVETNIPFTELKAHVGLVAECFDYSFVSCTVPIKGTFSFDTVRGMSVIRVDFKDNICYLYEQIYS
ncbi:MAG: LCP family protein [Clostridia bacterium]|nr:LCP family protein [Clostridia bacterium]